MQFTSTLIALATFASVAVAFPAAEPIALERRIDDPGNPANLINCPPGGGADSCNLEVPCNRIRLNYGSRQQGHFIWYNNDISNIPKGITVGLSRLALTFEGGS